ncbi:hypothetical protein PENTCL1PPCAC_5578, partial [Pristionchus entomophagus]
FIYVLVSAEACRTIEYIIHVQVVNITIAHNILFFLGLLTNICSQFFLGAEFNKYAGVIWMCTCVELG